MVEFLITPEIVQEYVVYAHEQPQACAEKLQRVLQPVTRDYLMQVTPGERVRWCELYIAYLTCLDSLEATEERIEEMHRVADFLPGVIYKHESAAVWGAVQRNIAIVHYNFPLENEAESLALVEACLLNYLSVLRRTEDWEEWFDTTAFLLEVYLSVADPPRTGYAWALLQALKDVQEQQRFPDLIARVQHTIAPYSFDATSDLQKIEALLLVGKAHHMRGNFEESVAYYRKALDLEEFTKGRQTPLYRALEITWREMHSVLGNRLESGIPISELGHERTLLSSVEEELVFGAYIDEFARLSMACKNFHHASEILMKSEDLRARSLAAPTYGASFYFSVGKALEKKQSPATALAYFMIAKQICDHYEGLTILNKTALYDCIARVLVHQLRFTIPAKWYLEQSLQLKKAQPDCSGEALLESYNHLTNYALIQNDTETAQQYFDLYNDLFQQINATRRLDSILIFDALTKGRLAVAKAEYDIADLEFRVALYRQKVLEPDDHAKMATIYLELGNMYKLAGNLFRARDMYLKGINLLDVYEPGDYFVYEKLTYQLAIVHTNLGQIKNALAYARMSAHADSNRIGELFSVGSPEHRYTILQYFYEKVHLILGLVLSLGTHDPEMNGNLYNYILRRKSLNAKVDYEHKRYYQNRSMLPAYDAVEKDLRDAYDALSKVILTGASAAHVRTAVERVDQALEAKELAVLDHQRFLPPLAIMQFLIHEDINSVMSGLPQGSYLLEFVKFRAMDSWYHRGYQTPGSTKDRYAVFVVQAFSNDIRFLDLGECEPIDTLVRKYLVLLGAPDSDLQELTLHGKSLKRRLLDSILPFVQDSQRLVICPDGDLALLPFESLPFQADCYMIDAFNISYVTSGREVTFFRSSANTALRPPVIMGDPAFTVDADVALLQETIYFKSLQGTKAEIQQVGELLGATPVSGAAVNKKALLSLHSPRFLHIATHGYSYSAYEFPGSKHLEFYRHMFSSGLCLSGINDFLQLGLPASDESGSGFLSAMDILHMDLSFTELTVLSACESGVGVHTDGEGLLGLRRAFFVAGTWSQLVSLWKIPDQKVVTLIAEFYKRLFQGEARMSALRNAQLNMKSRWVHPFYWASFILLGYPSKLNLKRGAMKSE